MGTKNKKNKKPEESSPNASSNLQSEKSVETSSTVQEDAVEGAVVDGGDENIEGMDETPAQKKSYRKRKKHYFNAVRAQMEFYFGDANLSKDRFLKQLMDKDPYVPLEVFLSFNKMKALTSSVADIAMSLRKSELLELDEAQLKVKRTTAISENRNEDEKTLYVEALPSSADHEWVRQIFERFGKVAYISLPKYAKSRKIKEFGFVEFEKEDSVHKALNFFKDFNGVLNMQQQDPAELSSVKTFIKEKEMQEPDSSVSTSSENRKRPTQDTNCDENEPKAKKVKSESKDEEDTTSNTEMATTQSESEAIENEEKSADDVAEIDKKKNRKRKKKSKSGEKLKRKAELNTDVSYYELKILPKRDWKRLRNKYLNLQREKVAELKRKAWRERQENIKQSKDIVKEENSSKMSEKDDKTKPKGSKHKLEKMNMNFYGAAAEEEAQPKTPTTEKSQHNPALERAPLFSYEPGLIVEMSFIEPCVNIKEYKADMRQYTSVKYVDVKEGSMQAYLRLETPEKANEFVQQISCAEYQSKILSGEAESTYWQKIEKDREQKLNKQVKIPQKRGREKVKKLVTKHIRFGDDDEE